MSLTFKCGCGKKHVKYNKTQVVTINNTTWDLDCYLSHMDEEYKSIKTESMLTQLILAEIKSSHPDIDVEKIGLNIAERLNNEFGDNSAGKVNNGVNGKNN